ncbi:MAG: hypothetical protein H0V82_12355 [Candidatus Protochlamydia sp.]|nr:hypothetical protein [Candidatus Protochlamydia sp.]
MVLQKTIGPLEEKIDEQKNIILNSVPLNISLLSGKNNSPDAKETAKQLEFVFYESIKSQVTISKSLAKMITEGKDSSVQIKRMKGLAKTAENLAKQGDINSAFIIANALAQSEVSKLAPKEYEKITETTKQIMRIALQGDGKLIESALTELTKKYGLQTYNQPLTTLASLGANASGDIEKSGEVSEERIIKINKFLTSTIELSKSSIKE